MKILTKTYYFLGIIFLLLIIASVLILKISTYINQNNQKEIKTYNLWRSELNVAYKCVNTPSTCGNSNRGAFSKSIEFIHTSSGLNSGAVIYSNKEFNKNIGHIEYELRSEYNELFYLDEDYPISMEFLKSQLQQVMKVCPSKVISVDQLEDLNKGLEKLRKELVQSYDNYMKKENAKTTK